jgi:hypothetical protein
MFQMTNEELKNWRSHFGTSNGDIMGLRYAPFVFTEQGVAMLSGVLNSNRAVAVNIQIMRVFTRMRELLMSHKELFLRVEQIEQELAGQGYEIKVLFEYLKKLMEVKAMEVDQENRNRIGFKKDSG